MIYGSTTPGASTANLPADTVILGDAFEIETTQYLVRVGAYVDGLGPTDADQVLRGVVYTAAGELVAAGESVTVEFGQQPGWVWPRFPGLDGLELPPGSYRFGIQAGASGAGARLHTGGPGARTAFSGHVFTDGAPGSLSGGVNTAVAASLLLETVGPVRVATGEGVTDDYLATMPFDLTQRVFCAAGTLRGTRVTARAGWYGTTFDPTSGANAIVRSDGPLAELVGERIRITRRYSGQQRTVAVYVHSEQTFPDELADEDLLLTRRAFFALGNPALDAVDVAIEVLA